MNDDQTKNETPELSDEQTEQVAGGATPYPINIEDLIYSPTNPGHPPPYGGSGSTDDNFGH